MVYQLITRGVIIGLSIAAPVGPIGLLCIRRSLERGMLMGLVTGVGAALADAFYGAVAGLGISSISTFLVSRSRVLAVIGGAYLLYLAVKTILSVSLSAVAREMRRESLGGCFVSTILLTLTNPATILSFVAIFAGLGISISAEVGHAWWFVAGVFVGSAIWWLFLSSFVGLLRAHVSPRMLRTINVVSGVVLGTFGMVAIWRGIHG